jgi:hypothetical protein
MNSITLKKSLMCSKDEKNFINRSFYPKGLELPALCNKLHVIKLKLKLQKVKDNVKKKIY